MKQGVERERRGLKRGSENEIVKAASEHGGYDYETTSERENVKGREGARRRVGPSFRRALSARGPGSGSGFQS